jgi:hypothetical protein
MKACTAGLVLVLLAGVVLLGHGTASATPADTRKNIDYVVWAYEWIARVQPSKVGSEGFAQIIRNRLTCYARSATPLERFRVCSTPYVDEIIRNARQYVKSKPDIGRFIWRVQFCPIIHSMCIGEHHGLEDCILMERQCIDAVLDLYWRGADAWPPRY